MEWKGRSGGRGRPKRHTKNNRRHWKKSSNITKTLYRKKNLEMPPKLKTAFKPFFDAGYRRLYLTEIITDVNIEIDSLSKCKNFTYNRRPTRCIKFVYGYSYYRTRCGLKHVHGIYLTE